MSRSISWRGRCAALALSMAARISAPGSMPNWSARRCWNAESARFTASMAALPCRMILKRSTFCQFWLSLREAKRPWSSSMATASNAPEEAMSCTTAALALETWAVPNSVNLTPPCSTTATGWSSAMATSCSALGRGLAVSVAAAVPASAGASSTPAAVVPSSLRAGRCADSLASLMQGVYRQPAGAGAGAVPASAEGRPREGGPTTRRAEKLWRGPWRQTTPSKPAPYNRRDVAAEQSVRADPPGADLVTPGHRRRGAHLPVPGAARGRGRLPHLGPGALLQHPGTDRHLRDAQLDSQRGAAARARPVRVVGPLPRAAAQPRDARRHPRRHRPLRLGARPGGRDARGSRGRGRGHGRQRRGLGGGLRRAWTLLRPEPHARAGGRRPRARPPRGERGGRGGR